MQKLTLFLLLSVISTYQVIRPRQKVPEFTALSVLGDKTTRVTTKDTAGKYTVLIFYPFDFTYVCPTELIAFSEKMEEFKKLDTLVYGVSTDSHFTHLAWTSTERKEGGVGKLDFPLISDFSKKMSRDFGFLVEDENDELNGAALRGLVIVGTDGVVRHVQINDAAVGRSVDETLRLIQAFKFTDKNGVVCPANWKPGSNTIKPGLKEKLEYFHSEF